MTIPYSPPRSGPTQAPEEVIDLSSSDDDREPIPLRLEPDLCTFNEEGVRSLFKQLQGPYLDRIMGTPQLSTPPFCTSRGLPSGDLREPLPTVVLHELLTVPAVRVWAVKEVGTSLNALPGATVVPVELAALVGYVLTTGAESALAFQIFDLSERLMGCKVPYQPLVKALGADLGGFLTYLEALKTHMKEMLAGSSSHSVSNIPSYFDCRREPSPPRLWFPPEVSQRVDYRMWTRLMNEETEVSRPFTNFMLYNNCNVKPTNKWNFYLRAFITYTGASSGYLINNEAGQIVLDTLLSDDKIRNWYEHAISHTYLIGRVGQNPIPLELSIYVGRILSGNISLLQCIKALPKPPFGLLLEAAIIECTDFFHYMEYLHTCYRDLTADIHKLEYGQLPPFGLWLKFKDKHFKTYERDI